MQALFPLSSELAWALALVLAWFAGELGHRLLALPRISLYGLVGFALGHSQTGLLPPPGEGGAVALLANIAFGLILFEVGYRINLRWLRNNPWLGVSGLLEAGLTFGLVYLLTRLYDMSVISGLLLAALSISTSPAAVLRVLNEQRGAGQVSERILHLCTFNSILAVFVYKIVLGFWVFQSSGSLLAAGWNSLAILLLSALLGAVCGVLFPALLRMLGKLANDASVVFALSVVLLVAIAHTCKLSPMLAALTFGLVARHRRVTLNQTRRNFGVLGDLLAVLLFVFVASMLELQHVLAGLGIALPLMAIRFVGKTVGVTLLARISGISWRKGWLTGLGLMPMSVFVILLQEQTRRLGLALDSEFAPLAAVTLLLEVLGPWLTYWALRLSGESAHEEEK